MCDKYRIKIHNLKAGHTFLFLLQCFYMIKRILVAFLLIFGALFTASLFDTNQHANAGATVLDALDNLTHPEFYMALANPTVAYVKVTPGMRKEQIAAAVENRLKWSSTDTKDFLGEADNGSVTPVEGKYFPDVYLVSKDISGEDLKVAMFDRFSDKTKDIKGSLAKNKINLDTAVTIASIIQREAGKTDMKLISGVIWNRLFNGMSLQMDATVQYAKGNEDNGWWPVVKASDIKTIDSPYNTYLNKGLPPGPIANPSLAALQAALSPQKTSCLYYFHKNGVIYCSNTYAEHEAKIKKYLQS